MNVYVINLNKEYYKFQLFLKNNSQYGKLFKFIRFPAFDKPDDPVKGCFLSHLAVAKLNSNKPYYIVMEDDCIIKPNQYKNLLLIVNFFIHNNYHIFNGNPNTDKISKNIIFPYPQLNFAQIKLAKSSNFLIVNNTCKLWELKYNGIPFDKHISQKYTIITYYPYVTSQFPNYSSIKGENVNYISVFKKSEEFIGNLINERTIHLIFQGKLGNRLFQLFTALTYCLQNKCILICTSNKPQNYNSKVLQKIKIYENYTTNNIVTDKNIYNPINLPSKTPFTLFGYFQNINNFYHYRNLFSPYLNLNPKMQSNVIGIHLRRTDFLSKSKTYINYTFEQCYEKALKIMNNPNILIFTDDIEQVKKETFGYPQITFFEGDEKESFENMMGLEYVILSNSTFCWMAIFLNKVLKKGFMPQKWLKTINGNPGNPHPNIIIEEF